MLTLTYDIETFDEIFIVVAYVPGEAIRKWEVSIWKNELDNFFKFAEDHLDYYWMGYNNLSFDGQIIEWIYRNYEKWYDLSSLEITAKIAQKAKDNIDDRNYNVFAEYREDTLTFKQLDLFLIWHFDNRNRMVSLKRLEFEMNFENIEESSIPFDKKNITRDEAVNAIKYCVNDVKATYQFYLYTIGEVEHKLYKGKNKITDRLVMQEEFELNCLNWSDVKIGANWNKMDFMALSGRSEQSLKPERVNYFYGKKYKQFFPNTIEFQTKGVKDFVRELGNTFILNKKQDFAYKFNDKLTINIGRGGIHSQEKARYIKPKDDEIYYQCDIGSQYPNAIRKYKIFPQHLGIQWNEMITKKIERRLGFKELAKKTKDPKYESLQEMGKLALNGGAYGRLNMKGDWQEDPCCMLKVTMGGQLEILMIVEALILKGYDVISVNTDGFDVIIKRDRNDEFKEICKYYEEKIGNSELGNIEYTEFLWIAQTSVNDYIAMKKDGSIKKKGEFMTDFELHKNKSKRVVPLALEQYFVNNILIKTTINSHTNIYDFCIRQKSSSNFHYEGISAGDKTVYNKLIRYYISLTGEKILKIKNPECTTNAAKVSQVNAGDFVMTVCNRIPKNYPLTNINHQYYIDKANEIIHRIEHDGRKPKKIDKQQLEIQW